jgi:hypothetical protein
VDIEAAAVTGNAGFSDDTADGNRARLHELFSFCHNFYDVGRSEYKY